MRTRTSRPSSRSRVTVTRTHRVVLKSRLFGCSATKLRSPLSTLSTLMSSNIEDFRNVLSRSSKIILLSGAGLSAASGVSFSPKRMTNT